MKNDKPVIAKKKSLVGQINISKTCVLSEWYACMSRKKTKWLTLNQEDVVCLVPPAMGT